MGKDAPEPFTSGTFAVFDLPDGGVVLALNVAGHGEVQQRVPAALVAIGKQLAAGQALTPAALVKALRPSRAARKALGAGPEVPPAP